MKTLSALKHLATNPRKGRDDRNERNDVSGKKKTITVDLRGGLANQLFQWAAAEFLSDKYGAEVVYDTRTVDRFADRGDQLTQLGLVDNAVRQSGLERRFWTGVSTRLPESVATHLSVRLRPATFLPSAVTIADAMGHLDRGQSVRLSGYFQEVDTYRAIRAKLRDKLLTRMTASAGTANDMPQRYAAMHVRRGDYVKNPIIAEKFGFCSVDYYVSAARKLTEPDLIIVSDDPEWCNEVLLPRIEVRGRAHVYAGLTHFDDFLALANAKNLVMSNSTFSWWAAFVGRSDRTIAPRPWMTDGSEEHLYSPEWMTIDRSTGA